MKKFCEYINTQHNKLLAHIVRAENTDPVRQCTLNPNSHMPYDVGTKRVGRPRENWAWKGYLRICVKHYPATAATFKADSSLYIGMVRGNILTRIIMC